MTNYQLTYIISDAEKRIIEHRLSINALKPQVDDYKKAYEDLRFQFEKGTEMLKQDEELLDWASRMKNQVATKKKLMVVRSESHNDMKPREQKKLRSGKKIEFTWTKYAREILSEMDRFVKTEDLWILVEKRHEVKKRLEEKGMLNRLPNIKCGAIKACWFKNAESTRNGGNK